MLSARIPGNKFLPMAKLIICMLLFAAIFSARAGGWSAVDSDHFAVMYTGNKSAALNIRRMAEDFYPKVTSDLGYLPKRKIIIWFSRTQKEFDLALGAPIQDWAAGAAYPQSARVVIRDPAYVKDKRLNLSRLVKHEIAHVVFGLYLGKNLKNVPRWFNEGIAMYEADEWSYGYYWTMLTGSLGNSLIPFYNLSGNFPQRENDARIAYAQSYSIISFTAREYGDEALRQCVKLLAEGRSIDDALSGAMGLDLSWLERKWLKNIKSRYKWLSLISSWVVLWTFIVLILIAAYWRRKVRNRRIIQQWEEEDEFWWEDDEMG